MTSGGARVRSGPQPQEHSARSDRRGYRLRVLPASDYAGPVPEFPLPEPSQREKVLWAEVWKLPQAHVWADSADRWRVYGIGMYVRQAVRCEAFDVSATHVAQLHRFADQIGLTDAGLAAMGWRVVTEEEQGSAGSMGRPSSRRRLRAAPSTAIERTER